MHAHASAPQALFYRYRKSVDRVRPPSRVEREAFDRLRNAVNALQELGAAAASVEQELCLAVETHVLGLEARYNGGQPFPDRGGWLAPGRRGGGVHKRTVEAGPAAGDGAGVGADEPQLALLHLVEDLR